MIPRLASPSICVIDDEKQDYAPILAALSKLGYAHTHIRGNNPTKLKPLKGIRLVFTDLHLSGHVGRDAAAYTANVFRSLFPPDTVPLVVVIWSKYADDPAGDATTPPGDQPTEAELFKTTLFEAVPSFRDSLHFCEMKKPKGRYRPRGSKWITKLKRDIQKELDGIAGFDVLWAWESLVKNAGIKLTESLTALAQKHGPGQEVADGQRISLNEKLMLALRMMVHEQGGPDCNKATAPRHLASILTQTLADHLDHSDSLKVLSKYGTWLADSSQLPKHTSSAPDLNGFLLTSTPSKKGLPFVPGTVYRLANEDKFKTLFGVKAGDLVNACYLKLNDAEPGWSREEWKTKAKPIFLEISPECDVHQGVRRNALLIAGLILPIAARSNAKSAGAFDTFPDFHLRWPIDGVGEQDSFMVFCSRYKVTMNPKREPRWLKPWFRLRELPAAALRNWHSGHAARVGYVSLRTS